MKTGVAAYGQAAASYASEAAVKAVSRVKNFAWQRRGANEVPRPCCHTYIHTYIHAYAHTYLQTLVL